MDGLLTLELSQERGDGLVPHLLGVGVDVGGQHLEQAEGRGTVATPAEGEGSVHLGRITR